jgi:hypothetical protein
MEPVTSLIAPKNVTCIEFLLIIELGTECNSVPREKISGHWYRSAIDARSVSDLLIYNKYLNTMEGVFSNASQQGESKR